MKQILAGAMACAALVTVNTGAAAQTSCISEPEARAFVELLAPEMIREAARVCTPRLPADAVLRGRSEVIAAKFEADGAAALPLAQSALQKISGLQISDPQLLPPVIKALAGPMIGSAIKPESCTAIDRAVTYLEPLPPQNLAGLLILIAQLSRKKQEPAKLDICPLGKQ